MGKLLGLLSGPAGSIISSIGDVIDNLHTSAEEKLAAKTKLLVIQQDFQMSLLAADVEMAKEGAETVRAEIASKSWMARNWRPSLMYLFMYIMLHQLVIAPVFGLAMLADPMSALPPEMWKLLYAGMIGYGGSRSVEKMFRDSKLAK